MEAIEKYFLYEKYAKQKLKKVAKNFI